MTTTTTSPRSIVTTRRRPGHPRQRTALLRLMILLIALTSAIVVASAMVHPVHAEPNQAGADDAKMQAAVQAAQWPQQNGIWCGIADVAAIASYRGYSTTQTATVSYLNSTAGQSAWGTPDHDYNVA